MYNVFVQVKHFFDVWKLIENASMVIEELAGSNCLSLEIIWQFLSSQIATPYLATLPATAVTAVVPAPAKNVLTVDIIWLIVLIKLFSG